MGLSFAYSVMDFQLTPYIILQNLIQNRWVQFVKCYMKINKNKTPSLFLNVHLGKRRGCYSWYSGVRTLVIFRSPVFCVSLRFLIGDV